MRAHFVLAFAALAVLMVPVPAVAQGVPALPAAPAVPGAPAVPAVPGAPAVPADPAAWLGTYQGVPYQVLDGVVSRLDGQKVDPAAADEVLKAKRVSDLLEANPALEEHLGSYGGAASLLTEKVGQAQAAADRLKSVAEALGVADAQSLLGDLLGELPVRPVHLASEAGALKGKIDQARGAVDQVSAASDRAQAALDGFQASHSVEDKRAVVESFLGAVPVYREAAQRAEEAAARAKRAALETQGVLDAVKARSESFLLDLGSIPDVPADLEGALVQLDGAALDLQGFADQLRSDAAYMQGVAREPVDSGLPVAWIVGGGAGASGLGLGSLWWLRRRAGLP